MLAETKNVRFEGNNYSDDWKKEAAKRKLYIEDVTPKAIAYYQNKECIDLFTSFNVLTERQMQF